MRASSCSLSFLSGGDDTWNCFSQDGDSDTLVSIIGALYASCLDGT